jgi:hypothetical protein
MLERLESIGIHSMRMVGRQEAHGACPRCGGKDRFVVHAVREWPSWLWMCRQCSPDWAWLDQFDERLKRQITPEEKARMAEEKRKIDEARAEELRVATRKFTDAELWREMHRRMGDDNRAWWRKQGIPDSWQDYLELGYIAEKTIETPEGNKITPAYTIPYLREDGRAVTMQYRLVNPPTPGDKYRFQSKLQAAWYTTTPTWPLKDEVIVCEGSKKAMVARVTMWPDPLEKLSILAVPAMRSWCGLEKLLQQVGRVWVAFDPDGLSAAMDFARLIGKQARIIDLPGKLDDMINAAELTESQIRGLMRTARKVTQ